MLKAIIWMIYEECIVSRYMVNSVVNRLQLAICLSDANFSIGLCIRFLNMYMTQVVDFLT